uniref:Venom peptide Ht_186 n=1 Tax=Hadogenes troglodytes TaxID=1577150 RepID=A0A1B3IJ78_9SCOR|nr:venom peptide Ht_186 [Hadogenes troglodytes]
MKLYHILLLTVLVVLLEASASRVARQSEVETKDVNEIPTKDSDEFPDVDELEEPGFTFGFSLDTYHPFEEMFKHLEDTMKTFHDFMANATANIPDDYNSTTTDTMVIDGKTYNVRKTVIRKADNGSELFVRAFSMVPAEERKKRAVARLN